MSWSSRRRGIYFGVFGIIILLVFSFIYYLFFYQEPTCTDRKQNQDEEGIDCGGVCPLVCSFETADPIVLWARTFEVSQNFYNFFALIENPNIDAKAYNTPFSFRVYDKDNVLIQERRGKIDILPRVIMPVFERTVDVGNRIPVRTIFEFTDKPVWIKTQEEQPNLSVGSKDLTNLETTPLLKTSIQNKTTKTINNIEITAILYDNNGNAINISQTIIDSLVKNQSKDIVFTWSKPFEKTPARIEIIHLVK